MTVADALNDLRSRGISAVPIQTLRDLVDRHRASPTTTIAFEKRERDGWENECFAPTWYAFDGVPAPRPAAPPRIGSDAAAILATLGYTAGDVERLKVSGVVGPVSGSRVSSRESVVGSQESGISSPDLGVRSHLVADDSRLPTPH